MFISYKYTVELGVYISQLEAISSHILKAFPCSLIVFGFAIKEKKNRLMTAFFNTQRTTYWCLIIKENLRMNRRLSNMDAILQADEERQRKAQSD